MWENEIVPKHYEEWRTKGQSAKFKWWAKITPNLHVKVILDKVEKADDKIEESELSSYASLAAYQMTKTGYDNNKLADG